jgi:hypothetical protein
MTLMSECRCDVARDAVWMLKRGADTGGSCTRCPSRHHGREPEHQLQSRNPRARVRGVSIPSILLPTIGSGNVRQRPLLAHRVNPAFFRFCRATGNLLFDLDPIVTYARIEAAVPKLKDRFWRSSRLPQCRQPDNQRLFCADRPLSVSSPRTASRTAPS